MGRVAHLVGLALLTLVVNLFVPHAGAQEEAPIQRLCTDPRMVASGGVRDLMAGYYEAGLRCSISPPLTLTLGGRYTDQRGYTWPVAILSYDRPITPAWTMNLTGSLHERSGDYEIDRLPELGLRWTPQVGEAFVFPSVELYAGHIRAYNPSAEAGRIGGLLSFYTQTFSADPRTNATLFFKVGEYWYDTGATHSYWSGNVTLAFRPISVTEFALIYGEAQGYGASPFVYDFVTPDRVIAARVGFQLGSGDLVTAYASLNLLTSPTSMKEYILSWTRPGEWAAVATWRMSDGKVFFGLTVPP